MTKRPGKKRVTLIELCVERAGYRRGAKVMAFVIAWGRVRDDLGRQPSVEEYAEYWRQSRRTAFEDQEKFRDAFPELLTPDTILDLMGPQHDGGTFDVNALAAA